MAVGPILGIHFFFLNGTFLKPAARFLVLEKFEPYPSGAQKIQGANHVQGSALDLHLLEENGIA